MMKLKDNTVNISGLQPVMKDALPTIERVFDEILKYSVITSAFDGRHKSYSRHFVGLAVDLRTWESATSSVQLSNTAKEVLANALRQALGESFFVLVESDHIHISWKPASIKPAMEALIRRS